MRLPLGPVPGFVNGAVLAVVDEILESRLAGEIADRVVASPATRRAIDGALSGPVPDAIDRDALDQVVQRLLDSEELWLLVERIARSPAVTEAITQQSLGFADQVAGEVRDRSRSADAVLERVARRALRRRPPPAPAPE